MLSDRIFELIRAKGITQKEFSKRTGIPQSTISDWKKKGVNPTSEKLLRISEVLGISVYDLLSEHQKERTGCDYIYIDSSSNEARLVEVYRKLSQLQKSRLIGYAEALEKSMVD